MRANQAKQLRRLARALTEEAPWAAYVRMRKDGSIALHPECGRALYRKFKHGYRRLARKEAAALQLMQKIRSAA